MGKIDNSEIISLYNSIRDLHRDNLSQHGVKLPRLKSGNSYTKDALVLCYLFKNIGNPVSKSELTDFVRQYFPDTNDVQQARHLGRQKGFFIVSGTRGDMFDAIPSLSEISLGKNDYCLVNLNQPYPGYSGIDGHRSSRGGSNLNDLIKNYNFRCATCGSKQGEGNLLNPLVKTQLQEGHMNPNLPLSETNTIPQCSECNRAYRDWFVFDGNGRVVDINITSPRWQKKYKLI